MSIADRLPLSLERQRAQLAAIVESSPAPAIAFGIDRTVLAWNAAAEATFGWTADEVVGRALPEMVPERERASAAERIARTLAGEAIRGERTVRLTRDGRELLVEIWAARLVDGDGKPSGFAGQMFDVTDRVELEAAEAARAAAEARFHELLESVALCSMILDTEGRIVFANDFLCSVVDWPPAELHGRDWFETCRTPVDRPEARAWLAEVVSGEDVIERRHENQVVTRTGALRTVRWSTTVLRDEHGAVTGIASIGEDVTEARDAETELTRLAAAVEQASDMIAITAEDGTIQYVNHAFELESGYASEDAVGRELVSLVRSGEHDDAFYRELDVATSASHAWADTIIDRRRDGSLHEINLRISPIKGPAGEVAGFVHVGRDLTRERALEGQLRQAVKMEAIGQLAGGVAHDFNNMLTAIRGYAELIDAAVSPEELGIREDLAQIVLTADRAAALTRQLLAFARKQVVKPAILDPTDVVTGLGPMLRRLLGEHVELVIEAQPGLGSILVDPHQLEQVVVNLAVNGRDAMPGGGRLTLALADVMLGPKDAAAWPDLQPGPHVELTVTDTGAGMTPETRERVFEPFFTTKAPGQGTGMGLATVHGIVTGSGGAVRVDSEPGLGARFRVRFPRRESVPRHARGRASNRSVPGGRGTVLLVEDEPTVRSFAARCLRQLGYAVVEAASGAEALALDERPAFKPAILVTDVAMPGMPGTELARSLRARRPGLPVLFVSGYADATIVGAGWTDDAAGYLAKPYTRESLAQAVAEALVVSRPARPARRS